MNFFCLYLSLIEVPKFKKDRNHGRVVSETKLISKKRKR